MTIVYFSEGESLEYANPKVARAKLRKMGLTVRDAIKRGEDYHFNVPKPEGASGIRPIRSPRQTTQTISNMGRDCTISLKEIEIEVLQKEVSIIVTPMLPVHGIPILGKDLVAGDSIMNFVPGIHLTIDIPGVHEIVIPAPNITRIENRYMGFYSIESGGMLSYKIDLEKLYDTVR